MIFYYKVKTTRKAPTNFSIETASASLQAGLWITARSIFERFPPQTAVESVCAILGVGRGSAYATAGMISSRLHRAQPKESAKPCDKIRCGAVREKDFEIEVLRYQLNNPGCRQAGVRIQFDLAYKAFVEDRRAHYGLFNERVSQILSIPLDTLKKFPRFVAAEASPAAEQSQGLPSFVIELANEYLRGGRRGAKSVKQFCDRNPELLKRLAMTYRQPTRSTRPTAMCSTISNRPPPSLFRFTYATHLLAL